MPSREFIHVWVVLLLLLNSSCHQSGRDRSRQGIDSLLLVSYRVNDVAIDSSLFDPPCQVGSLIYPDLSESSGLASSQRHPGYFWTEEDSGNPSEIQLIDQKGTIVARFEIDDVDNNDWEDITVGPGPVPGVSYIYLAEIGDNAFRYPEKLVYRFPEPALTGPKAPYEGHISTVETIRLKLPGGPRNAEAIVVDPVTKDLFMFSKGDESAVYRVSFPESLTRVTTMRCELVLPLALVTSAAISPDGSEILVRTYEQIFYYNRQPGESVIDALSRAPRRVPLAKESQGEAICWAVDGSGYFTTSERITILPEEVFFYHRKAR